MNSSEIDKPVAADDTEWNDGDRLAWIIVGVICAVIIAIVDGSPISAAIWLVMSLFRAYHGMPKARQMARRLSEKKRSFLLDVILGWALIPGPIVGSLFGTLSPILFDLPISSFSGGLLGLLAGPIFAALEGVIIASAFAFVWRIVTGVSLFDESR